MVRSRTPSQGGGSQGFEMERKYSVPSNPESRAFSGTTSEDLHAWSIYRQNLNSDFTDSALGSTDKSPLPYGNFQLRDTTVQSILSHPRYGPKSALGSNMYTYLKFGLPRVFPPNANGSHRSGTPQPGNARTNARLKNRVREGSSGYDSSDNETGNHNYKYSRKYRSDPDFRMQNVHPSYRENNGPTIPVPIAAMEQSGFRPTSRQWSKSKSNSEANLLSADYVKTYHNPHKDLRRNSVAEFGYQHDLANGTLNNCGRRISKEESLLSLNIPKKGNFGRPEYLLAPDDDGTVFLYPHLQLSGIGLWPKPSCYSSSRHLLVNDISLESRGGEILAIMSTCEEEGTAILDLISGRSKQALGDVILNGQRVKPSSLASRVAYVTQDNNLCRDMTALQILRFHYDLKKPTDKLGYFKIDPIDRINVLIEDLGLEQVRDTKVSAMTMSERKRLDVACHLLLDTDIVVLDQPSKGMDIFDTFFLVEYLRQWAKGGPGNTLGRIVILTLHPPTYEIFTMISRILLISAGRTMFSGKRRDMLPYFALADYPCPAFKNPSDYYLDLVTLDDLSAEAMLESSQRIEQLAEIFRQKQEPLSDPGPPSSLPLTVKPSNFLLQGLVLFTKAMVYTQSSTFLHWITIIITAVSLSLLNGAIFWNVPKTDFHLNLNDRPGYHYNVMAVTCWPLLLLLTASEIRRRRREVERDIHDGLYGRFTFIFFKILFNLFPSIFIWLNYLIPSYTMTGLYMQSPNDYDGFYIYLGVMLLYLGGLQMFMNVIIYLLPYSNAALIIGSGILTFLFSSSGYVIHIVDMPIYIQYLKYISPISWLVPYFLNKELSPEALATILTAPALCRNKQIQHQDIIVQLPCPAPNGTQILANYRFLNGQHYKNPIVASVVFYLIFLVLAYFVFVFNCNRKRSKKNDTARP